MWTVCWSGAARCKTCPLTWAGIGVPRKKISRATTRRRSAARKIRGRRHRLPHLLQRLQADVPELDAHGDSGVQLQGDDAVQAVVVGEVDGFDTVERQLDAIALREDFIRVPVLVVNQRFSYKPWRVLVLHESPAAALFLIKIPPGRMLVAHLGGVGL